MHTAPSAHLGPLDGWRGACEPSLLCGSGSRWAVQTGTSMSKLWASPAMKGRRHRSSAGQSVYVMRAMRHAGPWAGGRSSCLCGNPQPVPGGAALRALAPGDGAGPSEMPSAGDKPLLPSAGTSATCLILVSPSSPVHSALLQPGNSRTWSLLGPFRGAQTPRASGRARKAHEGHQGTNQCHDQRGWRTFSGCPDQRGKRGDPQNHRTSSSPSGGGGES